jgi:hypothetical protein
VTGLLLAIHVVAAILTIGPVTVSSSMFPPALRAALAAPEDARKSGVVMVLARTTRVYSVIGIIVPVFGLATGASLGVLGDPWLIASIILTVAAAAILLGLIIPAQSQALALVGTSTDAGSGAGPAPAGVVAPGALARNTGIFNLLWVIVVVLMIYRPGSTTGVGP